MKVFCDCGAEMFPSEDAQGQPEAVLQVVELSYFGQKRLDIRAVWYLCGGEKCRKSAAFIITTRGGPHDVRCRDVSPKRIL